MMVAFPDRFYEALRLFDEANARDPNQERAKGKSYPKELLYAQRMSACLEKLAPDASEALRLAARSQHICRWLIPRGTYPPGREGYKNWRKALCDLHADKAGGLMRQAGYDEDMIRQVQGFIVKKAYKADPESQLLEDVVCIVFLEFYFSDFARKHDEAKIISIVRKTWKKMSEQGHRAALQLPWNAADLQLVRKALHA